MLRKFKKSGIRHVENNFLLYFLLAIFFIMGIVFGSIYTNRLDLEHRIKFNAYFSWIFDSIVKKNLAGEIFKLSMISNLKIAFIMWLLGFFLIGIFVLYLIILWRGMAIGFTVGFLVKEFGFKGFILSLISLLPQYLIILPSFLLLGALSSSKALERRKNKGRLIYKKDFINHSMIILIFLFVITVASLVEGFVTPFVLRILRISI